MSNLNLANFLVEGLVYAPIYKKNATMISGRKATGKNPLEDSWDRDFGPADVELALRKNPNLQAVGIYTGIRGKGIVILDVDGDLKGLQKQWGHTLKGAPKITSTKKNAAKYLFRIPENLWSEVKGHGLRKDEGSEYEIIKNLPKEYFKKIKKMIIEYHMADTHPELLSELMEILESHNYKIETKKLFNDIGFLYAIRTND